MSTIRLRGLYAITETPPARDTRSFLAAIERALSGGVALLQYRDKRPDPAARRALAGEVRQLCREHLVPLIVNDDPQLARHIQADGVHVGQADGSLAEARALLGRGALLGASCYNRLELALQAEAEGADYVAFGRFFPSRTKPDAVQAEPGLLAEAHRALRVPLVAIGGITPENGRLLVEAGADMLAVIDGIFGQPDPAQAARAFAPLFGAQPPLMTGGGTAIARNNPLDPT